MTMLYCKNTLCGALDGDSEQANICLQAQMCELAIGCGMVDVFANRADCSISREQKKNKNKF